MAARRALLHPDAREWTDTGALRTAAAAGFAALWLWLACDGRLHWDEPGYWYTAAYFSVPEILAGDFQPSGIESFSVSRVGHVLLLKLLAAPAGPGVLSLALIIGAYLLMLAAFLRITHLILRTLSPDVPYAAGAVLLCAFTPIFVYLAFKTVAEIPALLLAAVAALAFLRSLDARPAPWLLLAAVALAGVAFTKNHIVLLYASLVAALLLTGGLRWPLRRVLVHGLVAGLGALAIFFAVLRSAGISLASYLTVLDFVAGIDDPVEARFLSLVLECGPFFLALPLAFLGPHKRQARFFALWFALATVPMLLSSRVEDRYLVSNLVPLAGLVQLSLAGIVPVVRRRWAGHRTQTAALVGTVAAVLLIPTALAQPVMFHGVRMDELHRVLQRLDERYGANGYALVTPSEYTVFLYLRFVEPGRPVYTVFRPAPPNHRDPLAWARFQARYYGPRVVRNLADLGALRGQPIYLSGEANLTLASVRELLARLPPSAVRRFGERLVAKMHPANPATMSWMWTDPAIELALETRQGPYLAWRVECRDPRACPQ